MMAVALRGFAQVETLLDEIRTMTAGAPVVVAFSGGLDSSTVAALARDALEAMRQEVGLP